jgi:hypothetical protein
MDRCHYCQTDGGKHQPGCPEEKFPFVDKKVPMTVEEQIRRRIEWHEGYGDGYARKPVQQTTLTYDLGWVQGDSAADEDENASTPWAI